MNFKMIGLVRRVLRRKLFSSRDHFSCSVQSDSLRAHGLQNVRLPCHHQLPWLAQVHVHWVGASLVAQLIKNLPEMQETWVWSLGWEDPLEKVKDTHDTILAWEFHGLYTHEEGLYGDTKNQTQRVTFTSFHFMESVMPCIYLIICFPLLLIPSIFPSIRVFSNESVLCVRSPKYWSIKFTISSSNEHSRLISFRIDSFDLLAVQGTLKSLFQHHSSKASILWCLTFL